MVFFSFQNVEQKELIYLKTTVILLKCPYKNIYLIYYVSNFNVKLFPIAWTVYLNV